MAVRKPSSRSTAKASYPPKPLDLSDAPVFRPTPEQIAAQMVQLKEFLAEWQAELGPFTDEQREAAERAWQDSL
jgi:hypothetical protein